MKVISLRKYKIMQQSHIAVSIYKQKIQKLEKIELLNELLKYHEDYMKNPTNLEATLRGKALLEVMEERAELTELKTLSKSFRQKIEARLARQLEPTFTVKAGSSSSH